MYDFPDNIDTYGKISGFVEGFYNTGYLKLYSYFRIENTMYNEIYHHLKDYMYLISWTASRNLAFCYSVNEVVVWCFNFSVHLSALLLVVWLIKTLAGNGLFR